jgi:hypothetical protein
MKERAQGQWKGDENDIRTVKTTRCGTQCQRRSLYLETNTRPIRQLSDVGDVGVVRDLGLVGVDLVQLNIVRGEPLKNHVEQPGVLLLRKSVRKTKGK